MGEHGGDVDLDILQKQEESSITLIHNHPGSHGFSMKDINFLLTNQAGGCIIAVGHKGNLFVLRKPKGIDIFSFYDELGKRGLNDENEEYILVDILREMGEDYEER